MERRCADAEEVGESRCGEERICDGLVIRERECGAELAADDREQHLSGWGRATVELGEAEDRGSVVAGLEFDRDGEVRGRDRFRRRGSTRGCGPCPVPRLGFPSRVPRSEPFFGAA